ncbi:hypothetical protein SAMN05444004_10350 [Jannaschia faecimaris]|uniref:Uncharacterized protein n=1 Tax=Jannaschia faecimaris TaxID=1244108 RepID=A0A1H3MH00_9RHOB|nr:hypothetical protein SAMN05444004_10350 [Jannaschia faecimaris]
MGFGDERLEGSAAANNVRAKFEYTKVSFGILRKV